VIVKINGVMMMMVVVVVVVVVMMMMMPATDKPERYFARHLDDT
jgi:hypothetical protein